ncbi:MAG: hypothetical protein SNH94_00140 [Rikenellaceae bacterium]
MKKVRYDNCPSALAPVGNGGYLYRWEISEVEVEATPDVDPCTLWECYEVTVSEDLTKAAITEEVIDALWGGGVEQKLLNDFQAFQLGLLDESYETPYTEFLAQRKALKEQIATDYARWMSEM